VHTFTFEVVMDSLIRQRRPERRRRFV
jgi:hypothetical protein